MKNLFLFILGLMVTFVASAQNNFTVKPRTYLFVHGAWGGGWEYQKVDSILSANGHIVYRPTMTGLGDRVHLASQDIGLSTHINDIVNVILFENLSGVVLVGHSYGGMVITGVAHQVPERISQLVYLDAFIPENGESLFATMEPGGDEMTKPFTKDGFVHYYFGPTFPTPPTDVPQPLKTFTEPLSYKENKSMKIPTFFILMTAHDGNEVFAPFAAKAKNKGWEVFTLEGGHYPMRDQPFNLVKILENCK